jgi:hypothetical protein
MWILPRQLHTSAFVPDTEALISDSTEQSQICAQSLLARSKPSPARTWLQRWKRDSWTQHLSGRILKPSHGPSFVTAWTSSLAATRASHSAQPASASEPKTHDTSGLTYQPELLQCDQVSVSLKTSRDISALGYPTLSKTWTDWVTERRGAWRARVNVARLTRGSGSLSWRTPTEAETHNQDYSSQTYLQNQVNWPSPVASEVRQGFQDRSKGMKGSQESLTTVVMKGWPTPNASDSLQGGTTQGNRKDPNLSIAVHGQAAPANPSTLGSRQGLWPTARSLDGSVNESLETWTARHHRKEAEGINLHRPLPIAVMQEQAKTQDFPTPRTCDWKSSPNADSNIKRMEVGQATLAEFVHAKHKKGDLWSTPRTGATESSRPNNKGGIPLADQAKREQWATPQAHDAQGPKTPEQIAVMRAKGHGVKNLNEQAQWGSPRTGIRGDTHFSYDRGKHNIEEQAGASMKGGGKLNPRWVETLMGLPIGWTMPSCTSPVTIAPTSCDSWGTALCQPSQSERSDFLLASWPSPRAGESQQTDELSRLWVECGYKQPKTRRGKPRANNSTYDVTLETAVRGVAKAETNP